MNQFDAAPWIVGANLAFIAWIAWLLHRRGRARLEAQTALGQRVLERFESAKEAAEFLESEAGRRLLGTLGASSSPANKILGSITGGIILCAIGLGILLAAQTLKMPQASFPGGVILATGLGCLVAAWVSRRLSVRWGLVGSAGANEAGRRTEG